VTLNRKLSPAKAVHKGSLGNSPRELAFNSESYSISARAEQPRSDEYRSIPIHLPATISPSPRRFSTTLFDAGCTGSTRQWAERTLAPMFPLPLGRSLSTAVNSFCSPPLSRTRFGCGAENTQRINKQTPLQRRGCS
jgi:hypothetical protein